MSGLAWEEACAVDPAAGQVSLYPSESAAKCFRQGGPDALKSVAQKYGKEVSGAL